MSRQTLLRGFLWFLGLAGLFIGLEGGPREALKDFVPITVGLKWAVVNLGAFIAATLGYLLLLTSRVRWVRWVTHGASSIAFAATLCSSWIVKSSYNMSLAQTVIDGVQTRREVEQTLALYRVELLVSIIAGLVMTRFLARTVGATLPHSPAKWLSVALLGGGPALWIMFDSGGGFSHFPTPFKVPALTLLASRSPHVDRRKQPVSLAPVRTPPAPLFVYLVDESVTGSMLSINGYAKATTPFLESLQQGLLNLGIASAGANYSKLSNHILISGVQLTDLPDTDGSSLRSPTIFQYARSASYRTYFMSATFPNAGLMSREDHAFIDDMTLFEAAQWWLRDRDIADRLVEILTQHARSGSRAFIYVNKIGPHYHYEYSYPPTAAIFGPTAPFPRWYQLIPVWDLSRMQNSYLNGIRWGVDEFFKYLLPKLEGLNVVILYTADHGQSMPTHLEPATHGAAVDPPLQQADVPLALLTTGDSVRSNLKPLLAEARQNINRATQFSLFASALVLMGYQRDEANQAYSPSIFDAPPAERWFASGGCIGRAPCHRNLFRPTAAATELRLRGLAGHQ